MNVNAQAFPAWVNGRMVPPGEPAIPADDQGFLLGLSVFDTMLFESGCLLFEDTHLERLAKGAQELGIEFGPGFDPSQALAEYVASFGEHMPDPVLLRVTATRGRVGHGPSMVVTARTFEPRSEDGVVLALARAPKAAGDPIEQIKSTNRLRNVLALEEARARGAFEALFITTDGQLSEGATSNLFLVLGSVEPGGPDRVVTPALDQACLAGTTRELVIEQLGQLGFPVEQRQLSLGDLAMAKEAFLTNTSQRAVAVRRVLDPEGQPFATRLAAQSAMTERAYRAVLDREADFRRACSQK